MTLQELNAVPAGALLFDALAFTHYVVVRNEEALLVLLVIGGRTFLPPTERPRSDLARLGQTHAHPVFWRDVARVA